MHEQISTIIKSSVTTLGAWLWTTLEPAVPFGAVCTAMVFADVISARRLAFRLRKKHPNCHQQLKFNSSRFGHIFGSLAKIYSVLLLATLVQNVIIGESFNLLKFVAGAICFWQAVSILENEASCNAHPWARILSKILIDKTERHLGISLDELRRMNNDKKSNL